MLPSLRRFHRLPDIVAGAPLSHFIGVIVPEATTNLVTNPSIETATTNYTAVGGSIARSSTKQYHGTYSLAITPTAAATDGVFYGTISLTSGSTYTLSCKFWGLPGVKYKISFATTGGVDLAVKAFIGTGRWQWVYITYTETSSTTRRLYFVKNTHTSTGVFYVDGVQVEALAYPTTYCDGDQLGLLVGQQPAPYLWTGTPNASTSTRSALTRAGGRVMNIRTAYGFLLTGLIGLGMAAPNNVSIPYTVLDGARYQRTQKLPRTFSLTGRFQASTRAQLDRLRSDMRAVLDRDYAPLPQPLLLMTEPRDDCGEVSGDFATVPCVYAGGLEGNDTSALAEDAAPTFTMYVPFLVGGDGGAALTGQQTVTNANYIIQRSAVGAWSAMSTGMTGTSVNSLTAGADGTIFAGGDFIDAGGSGADYLAQWNGTSWAVVGSATAVTGPVQALALGPDGAIYAGGSFTNVSGDANADRIAKWNGSAWSALGTGGAANAVLAITFDRSGNLYAGGSFTQMGGVANTTLIAKWNGSAWSAMATGFANGVVQAIAITSGGVIYAGGSFTEAGGSAGDRIARWTGSAWVRFPPGGMDAIVYALAVGPSGKLYAGGTFTTAGGVSASRVAVWNGTKWAPLGSGVNGDVYAMSFDAAGNLWVGGAFTTAGGVTMPDHLAVWNGSTWLYPGANLPGTAFTTAILTRSNNIYLGYNTSGSATTAAVTTATNATPAIVYPTYVIRGPSSGTSRIFELVNYTTGFGIWLNLTISPGEVVTLNTDPANYSFTSTFQGDLTNTVLPGSQPALMYLVPGSNALSFYAASSTVTATISWKNRYNGVSDLVN